MTRDLFFNFLPNPLASNTENYGKQTVYKNFADAAGVTLAYDVFRKQRYNPAPLALTPKVALTPQQIFFIGFAQSFCETQTAKAEIDQVKIGSALSRDRCNYSVKYTPEFQEAFKCKSGGLVLKKEEMCSVW